jgi:muramoyltetrapeptide carboxypeptidase
MRKTPIQTKPHRLTPLVPAFRLTPPKVGDVAYIVAPAGPFDRTLFWRGLGFLAQSFRLRWSNSVFARRGFLAGSAEQRTADLHRALTCPEARLVVCARGGVGAADLLDDSLNDTLDAAASNAKWLVGFSDITALHVRFNQRGWPSLHASNVTTLGVGCAAVRERWLSHVLDPWAERRWGLETLYPGTVTGTLFGGNLAVIHDLCAAGQWAAPPNTVLFLEEVAEPPYRIYRMLQALRRGAHLRNVVGLVVGQVSLSNPGLHRRTAREVVAQLCAEWQLPSAWGLPSGHELQVNHPLTLGAPVRLEAGAAAHLPSNSIDNSAVQRSAQLTTL